MTATYIELPTPRSAMTAYEVVPEGRARSAVLLLHEEFGLDEYTRQVARRLGIEGYHVIVPNLFHRTGGESVPYGQPEQVRAHIAVLSDAGVLSDVDASLAYLRHAGEWDDDQIGALGFGLGGRFALAAALRHDFGAAVSMCPTGVVSPSPSGHFATLDDQLGDLGAPWLAIFGASDSLTPLEDVVSLRRALDGAGSDVFTQVVRYRNAGHGFYCDMRATYAQEAAFDSWQRTLEWFEKRVAQRPSPYQAAWLAVQSAAG
jgi:carboxymethylenebutenolidase